MRQVRKLTKSQARKIEQLQAQFSEGYRQIGQLRKLLSEKDQQIERLRSGTDARNVEARKYVLGKYGYRGGLPVVDMLDLLPDLDETIIPYSFLEGQASPTDIALLKGLARMSTGCRYFEIGSWRGESIANVASIAEECVSLNLPKEDLRELGFTENFIRQHGFYSSGIHNIRHKEHNSHNFDFSPLQASLRFGVRGWRSFA